MNSLTKIIKAIFIGALLFNTCAHAKNEDIYYTKWVDVSGGMQNLVILPKDYMPARIGESVIIDKVKHFSVNLQQDKFKKDEIPTQGNLPSTIYVQFGEEKRKIESIGPSNPKKTLLSVYSNDDNSIIFGLNATFDDPKGKSILKTETLYLYNKSTKAAAVYQMTSTSVDPTKKDNDAFDSATLEKISYDTDKRKYFIQLKIDRKNLQWATARGAPVKPKTVNSSFYIQLDKSANGMKCAPVPKSIVTCVEDELTIPIQPTELVK